VAMSGLRRPYARLPRQVPPYNPQCVCPPPDTRQSSHMAEALSRYNACKRHTKRSVSAMYTPAQFTTAHASLPASRRYADSQ